MIQTKCNMPNENIKIIEILPKEISNTVKLQQLNQEFIVSTFTQEILVQLLVTNKAEES